MKPNLEVPGLSIRSRAAAVDGLLHHARFFFAEGTDQGSTKATTGKGVMQLG